MDINTEAWAKGTATLRRCESCGHRWTTRLTDKLPGKCSRCQAPYRDDAAAQERQVLDAMATDPAKRKRILAIALK